MISEELMDLLNEAIAFDHSNVKSNEKAEELNAESVKSFNNEKLCSIIASNRYLKINSGIELLCMKELADRRSKGDTFQFENQISKYSKSFTPINKKIPDIFEFFKNFKK